MAILQPTSDPKTPQGALTRLRREATRFALDSAADCPRAVFGRALLATVDFLHVAYANNHSALVRELWTSARLLHERILSLPKLRSR